MLLAPVFELLRSRCLDRCLNFLDLVSIMSVVIKHLPFFRRPFIELLLLSPDLFLSNYILDPVLHLTEHLARASIIHKPSRATVSPLHLHLVVLVLILGNVWTVISS